MASNVLIFPTANSQRPPHLAPRHAKPVSGRPQRIHLCDRIACAPTPLDRTHHEHASRPLDLAAQVGLTVSHVHRRITEHTASERQRHYLSPTDDTPDIPA